MFATHADQVSLKMREVFEKVEFDQNIKLYKDKQQLEAKIR